MTFLQALLAVLSCLATANAQCANGMCPTAAPYDPATLKTDNTYLYVATQACPAYSNPGWNNPNDACRQQQNFSIPLRPTFSKIPIPTGERIGERFGVHYLRADPQPILGTIGVLVNGVVVYGVGAPCSSRRNQCPPNGLSRFVDAFDAESDTFDQCGGHPDGQSRYHIHTGNNFTTNEGRRMCSLPEDTPGEHSALLGWMFDGFPLYGQYSQGGVLPTQLDSCHGHTHEINGTMQYHYHLPTGFPWMIGCFKGCPIASNNPVQLNFNNNASYGCPTGVATDPSPVYEDSPTSGAATLLTNVLSLIIVVATILAIVM